MDFWLRRLCIQFTVTPGRCDPRGSLLPRVTLHPRSQAPAWERTLWKLRFPDPEPADLYVLTYRSADVELVPEL